MDKEDEISGKEITIIIFFIALYLIYMRGLNEAIRYLFSGFTARLPELFSTTLSILWVVCIFLAGGYFFNENDIKKKKWLEFYRFLTKYLFFWITPFFVIFLITSYIFSFLVKFFIKNPFIFVTFIIVWFLLFIIVLWISEIMRLIKKHENE